MTLIYQSFSPDISFAPGRCFRTWVLTTYLFFCPSLPLRPIAQTSVPLPSTFRKLARMASPHTLTVTVLLKKNTRLFPFPSLAPNTVKFSIPFGRIKRPSKTWWSVEVESAVNGKRKAFAAAHRSDEDRQAYISASRQSSPRPWLRHGRRPALLFYLNLYTLFFVISLTILPRLLTVLLPGNRLRSMPIIWDPTFSFLSQRTCVAELETTFLSSAEPRARRSLTRPSAFLSLPLNFLLLPPIFPPPLPLAQTKLPISC